MTEAMTGQHDDGDIGVLFVCMGNICRSPTAEGVFRKLHQKLAPELGISVDSAGTHAYHVGEPPDARAVLTAQLHGIDISAHRGRVISLRDFTEFDYILAMDHANLRRLQAMQPHDSRARMHLLLAFANDTRTDEVPDPYYGGAAGFERILELVERGGIGLLRHLCREQGRACNFASSIIKKHAPP